MKGKPRKPPREKDLTSRYLSGDVDEDRVESVERFGDRTRQARQTKFARTAVLQAESAGQDLDTLPIGFVVQVFSLFCEVEHERARYLCVVRKTISKLAETSIVVGDRVRFRLGMPGADRPEQGVDVIRGDGPQGVVEQMMPRQTVLTRADSFKAQLEHPIVANAEQMLIVVAVRQPRPKWGLVDRMTVAARGGGLSPIICLNKIDLPEEGAEDLAAARANIAHYHSMGIDVLETSVIENRGIAELSAKLQGKVTVLAGHSGAGKSSLISAVQPGLDIRVAEVSAITDKGRHTTTGARWYDLNIGGAVIDTPGVKLFGLWNVTAENLEEFFPDVEAGTAPPWREDSFRRIAASVEK
jgi:ribosome biogenesis GTPase / thiamine phosphate phosphatase